MGLTVRHYISTHFNDISSNYWNFSVFSNQRAFMRILKISSIRLTSNLWNNMHCFWQLQVIELINENDEIQANPTGEIPRPVKAISRKNGASELFTRLILIE